MQDGREQAEARVSVVICARNATDFIDAALASIVSQTRAADEVVVVDDASTDDTAARVEGWTDRLPLTLLRLPVGRGVAGARRAGIEVSTGDVIATLDADDYWLPDHLEVLSGLHRQHGGIITASHYRWVPGRSMGNRSSGELTPIPPPEEQRKAILAHNFVFSGSLYARSLYDEVGGLREGVVCDDWDLWIRMIRAGARVFTPDTVTMLYRIHPGSVTTGGTILNGDIALLTELLATATEWEKPLIRQALRRRYAKGLMERSYDETTAGHIARARWLLLRAAIMDRNVHRTPSHWGASLTLRALACFVAPRQALRYRDLTWHSSEGRVGVKISDQARRGAGRLRRSRA